MNSTMTQQRTRTFSARPWAIVQVDDSGDAIGAVLTALSADLRAHGPVVGYDAASRELDAIFQVDLLMSVPSLTTLGVAADVAADTFADALTRAGITPQRVGLAIVEGEDPDQLP